MFIVYNICNDTLSRTRTPIYFIFCPIVTLLAVINSITIHISMQGAIESYSWECGNGYTPGLNIKGVCREKECITHEEDIICDMPFDHFDLATHAPGIKCPNCGSHVDPDTIIFYQCKWEVKGKWWESFSKPAENYGDQGEVGDKTKEFPISSEGGKWLKLTVDVDH